MPTAYTTVAASAPTPTITNPSRPGIWSSTGTTPAATHPSWKRVSNWANARPRFASGASRCTTASNASRPIAAAKFTEPARSIPDTTPPSTAVPSPASASSDSAETSIVSSRTRERISGATALPVIVNRLAKPSDRPNHTRPASCARNQKNRWKKVNPALARSNSIAFDARTTRSELSSASSVRSAERSAITSRGRRVAARKAAQKITAA